MDAHLNFPPHHGKIACAKCFDLPGTVVDSGPWRFRNDPGHWGSSNPRFLILGFSKGRTQADVYNKGDFDAVAFAGLRERLKRVLVTLGLMALDESIDQKFRASEQEFAFASLVRCSVARRTGPSQTLKTSGEFILRVFSETVPQRLLRNCSHSFLKPLPPRLQVVVMLGSQDKYIAECEKLIASLYGTTFAHVNAVAYMSGPIIWVHAAHPSRANGWLNPWLTDPPNSSPMACKRELARQAIQRRPDAV